MMIWDYLTFKRLTDSLLAIVILAVMLPVFIFIAICIALESKGNIFFKQERIGINFNPFTLYKFRTMFINSDSIKLTVGMRDPRITRVGYFLRKYKLDELPQFINILRGEMSIVGPRPEVREHIQLFKKDYVDILKVKPGLTDYGSLLFANENQILESFPDPHDAYINFIMPKKIKLNKRYIRDMSLITDFKLIVKTILRLFLYRDYYLKMEYFPS
jgi:lipopolysaccharide/colanic/teichoic acid biosynthesis glycosyltransferase